MRTANKPLQRKTAARLALARAVPRPFGDEKIILTGSQSGWAAAGQVQVSVEGAVAALDSKAWELLVAEERPRAVAGSGVDALIRARRQT